MRFVCCVAADVKLPFISLLQRIVTDGTQDVNGCCLFTGMDKVTMIPCSVDINMSNRSFPALCNSTVVLLYVITF